MISANEIRKNNNDLFNETFDFKSFDRYVEEYFKSGKNFLYIGIVPNWVTRDWAKANEKHCETLSFRKEWDCYIWKTNIQVAELVDSQVVGYLNKNGFNTNQKGACGYDHYDVIVVSV